jgi:hypothetical protein
MTVLRQRFVWICLLLLAASCTGSEQVEFVDAEVCDNLDDDDGDGWTDCADPDCREDEACVGEATEHCYDLIDNDFDGEVDCDDNECADRIVCTPSLESCASGSDDDQDGDVDCEDADCAGTIVCVQNGEDCTNGTDDDGDGQDDCEDPDCENTAFCGKRPEQCDTDVDEDFDDAAGCEDDDCAATSFCLDGGERCDNGLDDDGDGRTDCRDVDCAYNSVCLGGRELCSNGVDDDDDGLADCRDADCENLPRCQDPLEVCDNRIDDDGDGFIDCADPDCVAQGACELCANGEDDDGDGAADCKDSACFFTPLCPCTGSDEDGDADGIPACYDDDLDNDGVPNEEDACPRDDAGSEPDDCDVDSDGDGVPNSQDNCRFIPNPQQTTESCDDADGDRIADIHDNCPDDPNPRQVDRDDFLLLETPVGDACDQLFELHEDAVGSQYRVLFGEAGDRVGEFITHGDLNGDGVPDLVVGMPQRGSTGEVLVFFGPLQIGGGGRSIAASDVRFSYAVTPPNTSPELGKTVIADRDFDGDGIDDLVAAAPGDEKVFVFFGATDLSGDVTDDAADLTISGASTNAFGADVFAPGDFDADGVPDLIVVDENTANTWHLFSGQSLLQISGGSADENDSDYSIAGESLVDWERPDFYVQDVLGDASPEWLIIDSEWNGERGRITRYLGEDTIPATFSPTPERWVDSNSAGDAVGRGFAFVGDFDAGGGIGFVTTRENLASRPGATGVLQLYSVQSDGVTVNLTSDLPGTSAYPLNGDIARSDDLSGDGTPDLVVTSTDGSDQATATVILGDRLLRTGAGLTPRPRVFEAQPTGSPAPGRVIRAVADVDWTGDGVDDLLIAGATAQGPQGEIEAGVIWLWPNVWHTEVR